jgi:hypothetical protein
MACVSTKTNPFSAALAFLHTFSLNVGRGNPECGPRAVCLRDTRRGCTRIESPIAQVASFPGWGRARETGTRPGGPRTGVDGDVRPYHFRQRLGPARPSYPSDELGGPFSRRRRLWITRGTHAGRAVSRWGREVRHWRYIRGLALTTGNSQPFRDLAATGTPPPWLRSAPTPAAAPADGSGGAAAAARCPPGA